MKKFSYSVTLDWEDDDLYRFLSNLRRGLGSFHTPVHISIASFLRLADDGPGLTSLRSFLRQVSQTHSAHQVLLGKMKAEEVFGENIVAVPVVLVGEFAKIWEAFQTKSATSAFLTYTFAQIPVSGIGTKFSPHVTIATGELAGDIHEYVRVSLDNWAARHGRMSARAVGLQLWEHTTDAKVPLLVESFALQTSCMCSICERARRLDVHGCCCTICVRAVKRET
ncbi:hypothetical protein C8F01DRAFT_1118893 [Mycena amicta]|nr:hypothetical protein C8F01DRAFT_1118893 [Mycena amicta]